MNNKDNSSNSNRDSPEYVRIHKPVYVKKNEAPETYVRLISFNTREIKEKYPTEYKYLSIVILHILSYFSNNPGTDIIWLDKSELEASGLSPHKYRKTLDILVSLKIIKVFKKRPCYIVNTNIINCGRTNSVFG